MKETVKRAGIWLAFEVAALWFTTHVGGGFALGTQEVNFFVRFGKSALIFPLVAMGILAVLLYVCWEYQRLYHIADYKEFFTKLFGPAGRFMQVLFDVIFSVLVVLAAGAAIAGFGNALGGLLGGVTIPLWVGYILAAVVVWTLSSFTLQLVLDSSAYMSFGIIFVIILLVVFRLPKIGAGLAALPSTPIFGGSGTPFLKSAFVMMLTYAGYQAAAMGSYINGGTVLKTHRDTVTTAILGFLLNGILLTLMVLVIAGNYPGIVKEATPVVAIVKQMGPFFSISYNLMLLLALVTTAVSLVFSSARRWAKYGDGAKGRWGDSKFRIKIWVPIWIVLSWAVANLGIVTIVKKGYGYLGYVGVVVLIIPILIIAPMKIAQKNRELAGSKSQ
jgi:uncharacterized membrane protein YkvI